MAAIGPLEVTSAAALASALQDGVTKGVGWVWNRCRKGFRCLGEGGEGETDPLCTPHLISASQRAGRGQETYEEMICDPLGALCSLQSVAVHASSQAWASQAVVRL